MSAPRHGGPPGPKARLDIDWTFASLRLANLLMTQDFYGCSRLSSLLYKGSGDAMKDHLSGVVQLFFDGPTTAIANVQTGRVKLIATAAETRKAALPDLPTMREQGYDIGMWGYLWFW